MTNLAFIYTGNVGSTPLIELAARHEKIFVPVVEHFDLYKFKDQAGEEPPCAALARVLDSIFRRQPIPFYDGVRRPPGQADGIPDGEAVPHLVFKWRLKGYGRASPSSASLRETLTTHAVVPVMLVRHSVAEQALKVHISEKTYGGRHQQFKAGAMSAEDYQEYLRQQDEVRITLDASDLDRVRGLAKNFAKRTQQNAEDARYLFGHVDRPWLVQTEDFLRPMIDRARTSALLSRVLSTEIVLGDDVEPAVRKAGLGIEHCTNAEIIWSDGELSKIERNYKKTLQAFRPVFPSDATATETEPARAGLNGLLARLGLRS